MSIDELANATRDLPASNDTERGLKGLMLGVVYSLQRADLLGFKSRTGDQLAAYEAELDEVGGCLAEGRDPQRKWLAGFYFNAALYRIAAAAHRALGVLLQVENVSFACLADVAEQQKLVEDLDLGLLRRVYRDVNKFKHEKEAPLLKSRKVRTLPEAITAAAQLLCLISGAHERGAAPQ